MKVIPDDDDHVIRLSGNSINCSIVNSIRRAIMLYIPIYGFHKSNIVINVDQCYNMYNNDMIINQITQLPIFNIPNDFDIDAPETFLSNDMLKHLFNIVPDKETKKKILEIEFILSLRNETDENRHVTTHDAILKINGEIKKYYLKEESISILVLKPKEELSLKATADVGIAKVDAMYEATTNAVHVEESPTSYLLKYKSLGQLSGEEIFIKACLILKKKVGYLRDYLKNNYSDDTDQKTMKFILQGDDYTMGNLLESVLLRLSSVAVCGSKKEHIFVDQVTIEFKLNDGIKKTPINVLLEALDYLSKLFQKLITY
jgi:DNA-directed RNA polymerase subunit L